MPHLQFPVPPTPRQLESMPPPLPPHNQRTPLTPAPPAANDIVMKTPSTEETTPTGLERSVHAPSTQTPAPHAAPATSWQKASPPPTDEDTLLLDLIAVAEANKGMAVLSSRTPSTPSMFTPAPAGGFPITHRGLPGEFFYNLHPESMKAWLSAKPTKFFIRVYDYDGFDQTTLHAQIISNLRAVIGEIAASNGSAGTSYRIAPPSTPRSNNDSPPNTFLVHELEQPIANVILTQRVWSASKITFKAHPFEVKNIPSLIICLAGFISPDDDAALDTVRMMWSQPEIKEKISKLLTLHDPTFSGDEAQTRATEATAALIRSTRVELLDVKVTGGIPSPRYNIFVNSPTDNMRVWTKIKDLFFNLLYPSLLNGTAKPKKLFLCQICHSFTHLRGMCPLPAVLGWKGPKHAPKSTNNTRNPEKGRGHNRRGT